MRVTTYKVIKKSAPNMRIALVADLHDRPWGQVAQKLRMAQPDVILIAGDLTDTGWDGLTRNCYRFLIVCDSIAPTYYCPGNHERFMLNDVWDKNRKKIERTGAIVLEDECIQLENGVWIGGLAAPLRDDANKLLDRRAHRLTLAGVLRRLRKAHLDWAVPNLKWLEEFSRKDGIKILLSHHPEYYPAYIRKHPIDVIVSGHAHGGQIRIFGQGLFAPNQGFFPKYTSGVHDNRLVISKGLANNSGYVPRLGNPREIVIIELSAEHK